MKIREIMNVQHKIVEILEEYYWLCLDIWIRYVTDSKNFSGLEFRVQDMERGGTRMICKEFTEEDTE